MSVDGQVASAPGTVRVGDRTRTFTVVGAPDGEPGRALLLVFHGSKQDGTTFRAVTGGALDRLAEDGVVVAYLDGYRGNWNDARAQSSFPARRAGIDDVGFTRAAIDALVASHRVDPRRVVAVGYSNGGQMTMRLLHESPVALAGAVVVAAAMPEPSDFLLADAAPAPLPVLLVHGTRDPIVPSGGGPMRWWVRLLFKVGGRVLSMPDTARYFATRNGITARPTTVDLPHHGAAHDTTRVVRTDYHQPDLPGVRLYTVHGGGHTVPGPATGPALLGRTSHDIDLATEIADFFELTNRDQAGRGGS